MTTHLTPNQLVDRLESLKGQFLKSSRWLESADSETASFKEARGAWFLGSRKAITQVQIDMILMREYISKREWWPRHAGIIISDEDLKAILSEYERGRYFLLFHLVVSELEESLRRVFGHVVTEPKYTGQGIAQITNGLLGHLGLSSYEALFQLTRAIRNTIHNAGIYRPASTKQSVHRYEWKGQTLEMHVGWPPNIAWDFLIWLLGELNEAMLEIATAPNVLGAGPIPRWTEFPDPNVARYPRDDDTSQTQIRQ